jgi:hypothetical protein
MSAASEHPRSMTLKQFARHRFFKLLAAYRSARQQLHTEDGKRAFVVLSVQIHAAKAHVPKRLWPLVNR